MNYSSKTISDFVNFRNSKKFLFTPGPATLLSENIEGLMPCFGRGDSAYDEIEDEVLNALKNLSSHKNIVRMQGSSSLGLEIMINNFLYGKVLVISTGYYSDRLNQLVNFAFQNSGFIKKISYVNWNDLDNVKDNYDWVVGCPTETSMGLLIPIKFLKEIAGRVGARLMLDATASIGLESDHNLADVIGYSSCKGLFGLTGACFIAYNDLEINKINSFYLDINTHIEKKITGPYHTICSLYKVLKVHDKVKKSVVINKNKFIKRFSKNLVHEEKHQPLLCTHVNINFSKIKDNVILYQTRSKIKGSIICHLGEVHLHENAEGSIFDVLKINN